MSFLIILTLSAWAAEPGKTADPNVIPDVNTIITKANLMAYYQGADGKAKVTMTIIDKQGQKRNREFIILRKDVKDGGDQNYFVNFIMPADVRKMVFMVHKHTDVGKDDDRWLYLPALDLVKRIAATDKRTSFVGSDFLYEDVSGRSLLEDTHELTQTTDKFFIVKNLPKQPDKLFTYYNVTIDRKTYMPMKMEYYDTEGKLYRTIESVKLETIQGYPTVVKSVVTDLKSQSTTEMEFSDIKYDLNLGDVFTERYLRNPPAEARR
ncbi:MAG: outer membrane lipoprotein-sorting protein [Candidatus Brocadiia bacterium]|nr:MAG: outer membrane lipoprotein-sorting protein [Candidatus Brocadiia bacterium]